VFAFDLDEWARAAGAQTAGRDWSAPSASQPQADSPEDAGPLGFGPAGEYLGDYGRGLTQEGFAGLADRDGMLDRQAAQRELATQFDIIDPADLVSGVGGPATHAGNQVTPEEFQRIAKTYSDIRLGRTDLQLDTAGMTPEDAARFRAETMRDIGNLLQTDSGRGLLDAVAYQPLDHKTNIHLHTDPATGARDNSNAGGGNEAGAAAGSWADGIGTTAQVTYVPGDDGGIAKGSQSNAFPKMRSDVTLFHEMVHAYDAAYGIMDQTQLTATDAVTSSDVGLWGMEYQAAGLGAWAGDRLTENAYRAERRAIGATDVGERTTGGPTDDDMQDRTSYNPPTPRRSHHRRRRH
jgi:hypothetical protein